MKESTKDCQFFFVCQGKDCTKHGSKVLKKHLEQELKKQGHRNAQVIKTKCMDRCKFAPSIVLNNTWFGKVKDKDIPVLLEHLEK